MIIKSNNIFNFDDAETYTCQLIGYMFSGYRHFIIEVASNKNRAFLYFDGIEYYNGPLAWTGANFCIAESEELEKITDCFELNSQEELQLFIVSDKTISSDEKWTRIIAKNVVLSTESPDYWNPDLY